MPAETVGGFFFGVSQISGEGWVAPYRCPVMVTEVESCSTSALWPNRAAGRATGLRIWSIHPPGEGWMGRGKLLIRLEPCGKTMRYSRCGKKNQSVQTPRWVASATCPVQDWDVVLTVPALASVALDAAGYAINDSGPALRVW